MSIQPDQFDDDFEDDDPDESSVIKRLRKENRDKTNELKALREQAERSAELEKENALYKANLGSLTEAQQEAVLKTAKEFTADAIRSQAELLGFVQPPEPPAVPDGVEAFDRVADAAAGGSGGLNPADYDAEVATAQTPEQLRQVMAKYGRTPEIIE